MKKACFWLGILIVLFSSLLSCPFPKAFAASGDHFSLILLPDTQGYTYTQANSAILESQVSWILSNLHSQKIAFVLHEGDMTNDNTQDQWDRFTHAMKRMDENVPYALVVGNHDGINDPRYANFNASFPVSRFSQYSYFGGTFEPNKLENAYYLFSAAGRDWGILALEYYPRDQVLTWAGQIVDRYPNRHFIVVTHVFMYQDGDTTNPQLNNTRYGQIAGKYYQWAPTKVAGRNDGQQIWDTFVKHHRNITFVFNGHVLGSGVGRRVDTGENGNQVFQILANYQMLSNHGSGYLRIVDIYPDDKKFTVETYSPYLDQYKTDADNQFAYTSVNSFGSVSTSPTNTPTPTPTHHPTATPTPTPSVLAGDLNGDHHVDSADYDILVPYLGRTGAPGFIPADINRDGKVDIFDYNILVGNYGRTQ